MGVHDVEVHGMVYQLPEGEEAEGGNGWCLF